VLYIAKDSPLAKILTRISSGRDFEKRSPADFSQDRYAGAVEIGAVNYIEIALAGDYARCCRSIGACGRLNRHAN
jgi:hypothetical protein